MNAIKKNKEVANNLSNDFKSFSDEHLIFHMIYTAVDVQPNGFFRYIPPLGQKRFNCMRSRIDRRMEHYIKSGVLEKVNFQEKGSRDGLSRFLRFVDQDMTDLLFAVHGIHGQKGPIILGPGETDEDLESIKESLRGKKTSISDEKMDELSRITFKIQPLPASVETKLDTRRRWTLLESQPIEGVYFEGFEKGQLIDQIERKNTYPLTKKIPLEDLMSEDEILNVSTPAPVDTPKWETRSRRAVAKQLTTNNFENQIEEKVEPKHDQEPVQIQTPTPEDEKVYIRHEKVEVDDQISTGSYQDNEKDAGSFDESLLKIHIEDRAFDYLAKEDDSRVLALITETLTSNMKFLKELSMMLEGNKLKGQLQAIVDLKNRLEKENEQLRHQVEEESKKRLQLQTIMNETSIRNVQLDMMNEFQNFLNLTPQEMYQRRNEYARLIESKVHSAFQPFVDVSRKLRS